jgi:hypothetical protein
VRRYFVQTYNHRLGRENAHAVDAYDAADALTHVRMGLGSDEIITKLEPAPANEYSMAPAIAAMIEDPGHGRR